MKILFAYELLFPPYDEGVKKTAFMIAGELQNKHTTKLLRYLHSLPTLLNNLIFIARIILQKFIFKPEICIYMPQASLTFSSYIKIAILNLFYRNRLVIIGTQRRSLSNWQSSFIKRLSFPHIFVMSSTMVNDLAKLNIKSQTLDIGIDLNKYKPADNISNFYVKYNLPDDKKILLHVGHIRESRNIKWLIDVQKELDNVQVVIVGSTSTASEDELYKELIGSKVIVIRDYLPDVSELYQLADYYCFPVIINTAAMEVPLSVLESMATNTPVLTTRFGRLPELFPEEDNYYCYIEKASDIISQIKAGFGSEGNNREKMKDFTWLATAKKITSHTELFK